MLYLKKMTFMILQNMNLNNSTELLNNQPVDRQVYFDTERKNRKFINKLFINDTSHLIVIVFLGL